MPRVHPSLLADDPTAWSLVAARGDIPSYSVYNKPIRKADLDDRDYRVVTLSNGIQALLVHDAKTDKAAASLDVSVGHLSDPDDIPGLAHFCEHLLFMGTEQYPKENEYSEYLAKNGGSSNAFTAASNTNYYFKVNTDALVGALDRFSGFFHSPLFSPSCTLRELNAVDSENKKNLQHDMWRIFQLNKHLSKPGHPWVKFGTGNKKTLTEAARSLKAAQLKANAASKLTPPGGNSRNGSALPTPIPSRVASPAPSAVSVASDDEADGGAVGRETRRRLIEWWSKEYCASRMSLVVVGKESLDQLAELVAKLFTPIRNRGEDPHPLINDHFFGDNEMGTLVHVKTVMDFKAFEISWPFPYHTPMWRSKPEYILSQILGHEGPGSVFAYLKNKGWATSLSAGSQDLAHGFSMMKITVHLTNEGFTSYRQVLLAIYKYLNLLRSTPPPPSFFTEMQQLSEMQFRFQEKKASDHYAQELSDYLKYPTPRELVLAGPKIIFEHATKEVRELLETLTVGRGRVVVMAQSHSDAGSGKEGEEVKWEVEPWYGTEYTVRRLEDDFVKAASAPNDIPELHLPRPNAFIPTNLDVEKKDVTQPLKRPILIRKTPLAEVWHKQDDQFWVPKAFVSIDFRSPASFTSPRAAVLTKLYTELVRDSLNEYAYDAELAGLRYHLASHKLGVSVTVSGYNDKLHVLLQEVLERMKTLQVKEERLEVVREEIRQMWENFFLGNPYQLGDYHARWMLTENLFTYREQLKELPTVTVKDITEHMQTLLAQTHAHVLIHGNLRKEDALRIANLAEDIIASKPLPENERPLPLSRLLPPSCNYIWEMSAADPKQANGSVVHYVHFGDRAIPRLRVIFRLINNIINEPAFNILRTQEQLGYIVGSGEWLGTEYMGLRVVVQSERDTKYVESRIEAFYTHMKGVLEKMSAEQFEEHKKGLVHEWNKKLKSLREEYYRFYEAIQSGYLDFTRDEQDAIILQTITKQEVIDCFKKFVDPASPTRSKLSVHVKPQNPPPRRLSMQAAQAFVERLHAHNIAIDTDEFLHLSESLPPIAAVKAHMATILLGGGADADVAVPLATSPKTSTAAEGSEIESVPPSSAGTIVPDTLRVPSDPDVGRLLLQELEALGRQYPAEGEGDVQLSKAVEYITGGDATATNAFKRERLRLSGPPRPVEAFHDLPVSRF